MATENATLKEYLKEYFGFTKFKGQQEAIIKNLLDGKDTFVIMPTGGGKSLCYQLPALISEGTAIIISPLIALMKNQVDAMRGFSTNNGIAHFLNSSLNKTEINQVKSDILSGKTKMLYVAPESLTKQENVDFFKQIKISFFAIDEAHCISEWGHDFRPEYRRLRPIIESIDRVPIIALTATATPKVQEDILKNLGMQDATVFKSSFNRENLYYEVRPKKDVIKQIIKFIKQHPGKSGIVYCLSRKKVEELAEILQANGIKAVPYHAGLDANTRSRHQDMFLNEEIDVIVATIAFGMGIDKPDVRFVIHHDIPKSIESYYQETGRAGRDGGEGICLAFYSYKDIEKLEKFLQGKPVAEIEVGKQLIFEMVSYAESAVCRRKFLLHYFGEDYTDTACSEQGMCDNCKNPKKKFDGQEDVVTILKVIKELKEVFKTKYIAQFLAGKATTEIKNYKHDKHPLFGIGKTEIDLDLVGEQEFWTNDDDEEENDKLYKDDKYWEAIIRQCIIHGFVLKEIENYGVLKVTHKGEEFLKNPYPVDMVFPHRYEETDLDDDDDIITSTRGGSTGAADEVLFSMLKDLRKQVAKKHDLPPYVIFQDPSLEEMCIKYPITIQELTGITGVGQGKAEKFGKEFVDLIKKYVEENDIERPIDLVIKSVANKSSNKIFIIQSIDKKMDLKDIANAKGLSMDELITEIEQIVASGTRLNISYYLDDIIDEEYQEELLDYFREMEEDNIQQVLKEFGDVYTEEEIRLMRVKFISEMGN